MLSIVKIFVVIAAGLVMASGIWVAAVLLRTLTSNRPNPNQNPPTET
jgi:hypothetical protein